MGSNRFVGRVAIFGFAVIVLWYLTQRRAIEPYTGTTPSYRLYNSTAPLSRSKNAIATFLTGDTSDNNYFVSARILTYQFLHAPSTKLSKSSDITWLVLCTSSVPDAQKAQLQADGATVVEVADVPLSWWIRTGVTRWKDQFTKLRIFEMEEFERVLFIDADTMIMSDISPIFDELEVRNLISPLRSRSKEIKADEAPLPEKWLFAARSDNALTGERVHPFPPLQTTVFSAGFWLTAPDRRLFVYLLSIMRHWRRFDPHTMEQSLLNYAFRRDGVMPWIELHWQWSATWPNEDDARVGVATLHEKWWWTGPERLRAEWLARKHEMEEFFAEMGKN